jgi:hypothetical protein
MDCTDLYFINRRLAKCEVVMAMCFVGAVMGVMLVLSSWIFGTWQDIAVGSGLLVMSVTICVDTDTERYYWMAAKDRII